MNPLPDYFHLQLEDELRSRRVVVWYDPNLNPSRIRSP